VGRKCKAFPQYRAFPHTVENQVGLFVDLARPAVITATGNRVLGHKCPRLSKARLMLVSFCGCSTQAWVLSSSYGVIRANYRVIATKVAVYGCAFSDGIWPCTGIGVWGSAFVRSR
jgi:hypothetical protein